MKYPRCSQERLVMKASGQTAEDVSYLSPGRYDLCFNRVVAAQMAPPFRKLLPTIRLLPLRFVFGLGNGLLRGIEQDFLQVGVSFE